MMEWWQAVVLGIIEGVTEFLPVSSTGHLTIAEKLMGYQIDSAGITAFTAIIQIGAILSAILYFRKDIIRVASAWITGLFSKKARKKSDYKFGWAVIIGSLPIATVGLVFQDEIETVLRSLWFVAIMLIAWSGVMWYADRIATQKLKEDNVGWKDTLKIGLAQCIALIPGVSRSGATISAGLMLGFDRVTATRLSFFLGIPALVAAGILQAVTHAQYIDEGVGWTATIIGIVTSFIVGYISIAWLLKFVSNHDFTGFVIYRLVIGVVLITLLVTGTISAT
jgi:undecaprenyl-diphosphatase